MFYLFTEMDDIQLSKHTLTSLFTYLSTSVLDLLDNIYIRFGNKLYRQIVGIPMGTKCVPVVGADLFYFAMKEIL